MDRCSDNETMSLSMEFLPQIRKQFTGGVMPIAVCQKCVLDPFLPFLR